MTQTTYRLDRQPLATMLADGRTITRNYQTDGKVDSVTTPHGVYANSYDASSGRLTRVTTPEGDVVQQSYDGPLLTGESWSGTGVQGSVSFAYNNFFEVTASTVNNGTPVEYSYDNDGLLMSAGDLAIARDAASGFLTGTTVSTLSTSQAYNGFGEVASFSATAGTAALYGFTVTERDKLGRIVQREETVEGLTTHYQYGYDLTGRLTDVWTDSVSTAHYAYDANGNRLSKTTPLVMESGTYDAQDRVETYGGFSYVFGDAGDLLAKTETATGGTTEYDYDVFGNLRTVALPDGRVIDYEIDARNRRVGKTVDGAVEYRLLYLNQLEPVAVLDANNNVVATFVYGTKSHVPELMIAGGVTYRYVTDHLGSVRLVVNASSGAVVQRIDYDEFGVVTADTNPGWQPFGFAGGVYDADTGLVRFGARDYDAVTGRWTARDPIGFGGGQANLFAYVDGDPVNRIDVSGLAAPLIAGAVGAAIGGIYAALSTAAQGGSSAQVTAAFIAGAGGGFITGVSGAWLVAGLTSIPLAYAAVAGGLSTMLGSTGTTLLNILLDPLAEPRSKCGAGYLDPPQYSFSISALLATGVLGALSGGLLSGLSAPATVAGVASLEVAWGTATGSVDLLMSTVISWGG